MPNIEYATHPPEIRHVYHAPWNTRQIVERCCYNVRLSGRATKLLQFYAKQKHGFTPALKLIQRETGIAENKVYEIREEIEAKGLIRYTYDYQKEQGAIDILWERINIFAALTEPIVISRADRAAHKAEGYNPYRPRVTPAIYVGTRIGDSPERNVYKLVNPQEAPKLSKEIQASMKKLYGMRLSEYESIFGVPRDRYVCEVFLKEDSASGTQYVETVEGKERYEIIKAIDEAS